VCKNCKILLTPYFQYSFIKVADADDLPFGWKKAVSYVLTLEHPSGSSLGYAKRNPDKTFKLCPKAIDWGWSQFITSDRIQQEGYINNDSLTVRASVTVKSSSVSIDTLDAELYLKCAVEEGNAEAVKACLAQGASVNCQFKDDLYTPLHTACSSSASSGSLQVLTLLLDKGADGNACNKWRETPLLIAANNGNKAAVEALLDHGADPSLCSEAGWSALTFAAHKVSNVLLFHLAHTTFMILSQTYFDQFQGYEDIVALLISAGAPVNCRVTEDLSTPLHKACAGGKTGHLSAVKQLLDAGADVHALNKWRETPLLTAANHGQAASVEALLRTGADPCKCTDTGWSPLSIAAYKGHDDVVRILLEEGAPTEEADPTLSALLQAATKGLPETVDLLLRHGADHTVTTKKGDTALSILVEQNLIDAAVEMVTEYKASVPRCSRDRKKVQRARLLINLRLKQQERDGKVNDTIEDESDDSENDDDNTETASPPLHDSDDETPRNNSAKKKKNKLKQRPSAEERALAAEAALLQELEQEEVQKEQEQAASSKKAAKKKKKKEKERMLKLKEEKEKEEKEKAQREIKELERMQKIKEEKAKKEKERLEKEAKERVEREQQAVREKLKRAKEEALRKQKEQEQKTRERKDKLERKIQLSKATIRDEAAVSPIRDSGPKEEVRARTQRKPKTLPENDSRKSVSSPPTKPSPARRRGWETRSSDTSIASQVTRSIHPHSPRSLVPNLRSPVSQALPPRQSLVGTPTEIKDDSIAGKSLYQTVRLVPRNNQNGSFSLHESTSLLNRNTPTPLSSLTRTQSTVPIVTETFSVDDHMESMATCMVESFLDSDSPLLVSKALNDRPSSCNNMPPHHTGSIHSSAIGSSRSYVPGIEHPYVAVFRQEKLDALLRSCSQICASSTISDEGIRTIFFRWTLRASHGLSPVLDPVIPSWTRSEELITFLQRQFIAESRRYLDSGAVLNIEFLREIGTKVADLCIDASKEVARCREKILVQLYGDWSDQSIGVHGASIPGRHGEASIVIDWQGRSSVQLPAHVFASLERSYRGPAQRIMTAILSLAKRYETRRMLTDGTYLDKRLTSTTLTCLAKEINVLVEGYSDPLTVFGNNSFCGIYGDLDFLFGGFSPLGDDRGRSFPFENGCSLVLMMPSDNTVSSMYCHFIVDMLEKMDSMVPLSFAVIIPHESFHDLKAPPTYSDLPSLDPRLGGRQGVYVKKLEELPSGKHCFVHGDLGGTPIPSQTGSLFVLLQNEGGSKGYPVNDVSVLNILGSMRPVYEPMLSQVSHPFGIPNAAVSMSNSGATTMSIGSAVQAPLASFQGFDASISPTPPSPFASASSPFGPFGGGVSGTSINSRRTRLFDLVDDDGEENDHSVDVVSGMLSNLGVNMFENASGQDVDIEALSLYGLGKKETGSKRSQGKACLDPFSN